MNKTLINLDERSMTNIIKELLCLVNKSSWCYYTMDNIVEIKFTGNIYNVCDDIDKWLNTPERKHNVELLKGN